MASVVKELVENSIDAGATRIEISLSKDLLNLRIQDDGCGMNAEDAELCLQRHATSKVRDVHDLFDLQTRGFRGEAVPSIASVSRMELRTRPAKDNAGTRVVVNGGRIEKIEPVGCPAGTCFEIRDLFFNTPARRKFLKSPQREMNQILKTVVRQSMAAAETGFRVERDGDTVLDLPAGQGLEDRFLQLQGSRIDDALLPVRFERHVLPKGDGVTNTADGDGHTIRISGYLAHPHSSRSDRSAQYLFVNNRPFSQKQISASIEQACRGFLMVGRFPIYCLFIEVPGSQVDFNVHPTKEEVRFRDERSISGAAYHAVREPLEAHQLVPDMQLGDGDHPAPQLPPLEKGNYQSRSASGSSWSDSGDPLTSPSALINRAFEQKRAREVQTDLTLELAKTPASEVLTGNLNVSPAIPDGTETTPVSSDKKKKSSVPFAGPGEKKDKDFWQRPYEPEVLGQLALTYVVVRYGEELLIVDQHAAHERLRFLELQNRAENAEEGLSAQVLLVPQTFDVAAEQSSLLQDAVPEFERCGFGLEPFGGNTWAITSVPIVLERLNPVRVVQDVLDDHQHHGKSDRVADLRDQILIRAACHSSIRGGHYLTQNEMQELLVLMKRYQLSFTCPHGRPTIIRLSKEQLEKQFGRLGAGS